MFSRLIMALAFAAISFFAVSCDSDNDIETLAATSVEDLGLYSDVVQSIFEQNCITCHNSDDRKGEFSMETYEGLLKGGDTGYAIASGDKGDSELFLRITLPHDDDDFMPTEGKPPLSDTEVAVIGWWIEQGADQLKTVGDYEAIPAAIYDYSREILESQLSTEELERREQARVSLYANLAKIQSGLGIVVTPTKPNASTFSVETFAVQKSFNNETLAKFVPYADYIVHADFSGTRITDEGIEVLSQLKNLKSLNLSRTAITGISLSTLAKLEQLESLNLYGTPLSLEALEELSQLSQLKYLYLFQTKLEDESTINQLKQALPGCEFGLN
jgi:mono/diheme cytochrome c family protein